MIRSGEVMEKEISDRVIYKLYNTIAYFIAINLCFMAANLLFLAVFFGFGLSKESLFLVILSLIPLGPSMVATSEAMGKFFRKEEVSPFSDFFKSYIKNFRQTIKFWMGEVMIGAILIFNISYIMQVQNLYLILPILLFMCVMVILTNIYAVFYITKFEMDTRSLWVISIYSIYKYWKTTLLSIVILIASATLYIQLPIVSVLALFSIIAYLINYNLQKIETKVKERFVNGG